MVRVLCALLCLVGGEAGKAKVSVASGGGSKLPFGLSPVVDKDWDLLKGTVSVGGNYALADSAFTPKAVHVKAQRPGFKMKLSLLNPVSKRPKATATVTVGDLGDGDYVSVTLDSAEPTPRLLEVKRMTVMFAPMLSTLLIVNRMRALQLAARGRWTLTIATPLLLGRSRSVHIPR